jgi:membrane protein
MKASAQLALRVLRRMSSGDLTTTAAGIAMFSLLAAVPALATILSVYGLVADPGSIEGHLAGLSRVLPRDVVQFVVEQLQRAAESSSHKLSATLVMSLVLAVYSARRAVWAIMSGLNDAFGVHEQRSSLARLVTSLVVALGVLLAILALVCVVVLVPAATRLWGQLPASLEVLRWPFLLLIITWVLLVLYRKAPSAHPHPTVPGALVAVGVWLAASWGLSLWVEKVANYQILYGALASIVVVMLWFYLSAVSILVGAVVNAELGEAS